MNYSRILSSLMHKNVSHHYKLKVLKNFAYTLQLSKKYSTQSSQAEEIVVKEKIEVTRPTVTKWKRPPFVKSLFFGRFDTELLAFPEILNNELLSEVENYVKILNELYLKKAQTNIRTNRHKLYSWMATIVTRGPLEVNSNYIDKTGEIPGDLIQDLKDMGLFGRMMPKKYGGLDLTYTACTRLNEVIGLDWSLYSLLTAHEFLASKVILLFGTEEQKDKYLPLLATGKNIAAFCAAELDSGCDLVSITTSASLNMDENYIINGSKCWVTNAEIADVFIVFAKTKNSVHSDDTNISVFIVDRNSDGIFILPQEKICLKGVKTNFVNFKEVIVPKENLIGEIGAGCPIYLKIMEEFRIAMNSFTFGTLKALLDSSTQRIIDMERIETSVGDLQLVRNRLSKIACNIYAMESLAYFTAAILDSSENPDTILESSILKIFNSEGTLYCITELMSLLGSTSLMKDQHLERCFRDAMGLLMFDGPNDVSKLLIGLLGCKIVGQKKAEEIMKARSPFFFPRDTFRRLIRKYRLATNMVKYDQDLAGHIHPSLTYWGNKLEEKLQKFELAVEEVLSNHGKHVTETQIAPKKLAEAAVYLYAQTAVLARASRSYCIGLKNSTHEVEMASSFCVEADNILSKTLTDIFIGNARNNEGLHLQIGTQIIDCRGYFPEHPLKHNF